MKFSVALLALWLAAAGAAAQPLFPPGSAIGLEPPSGFVPSLAFSGFEQRETRTAIIFAEQPPAPPEALRASLAAPRLARQGISAEATTTPRVAGREAVLVRGRQGEGGAARAIWLMMLPGQGFTAFVTATLPRYPASAEEAGTVERALLSVALRAPDPAAARAALPFAFDETANLRFAGAMAGSVAVLMPAGRSSADLTAPRLSIASALQAAPREADRRRAAEEALRATIPNAQIDGSAALRLGTAEAVMLRAQAGPRRLQQWLIFSESGATLRVLAEASERDFTRLLPEFEQVVASIRRP
ncbi:hypothetical protein GXW71_16650 [Roseomonas hellenica]|uniref:DUF1795 domain-containing protein n=1 Tax=Plastoroseomonas hellenica TaxID=2687306 RepID=A0ABS5F0B0_9PROT|nr:hypothetical protein [Plastoroseomonas hellenica]MBR0665991.1 hypothetical protein [Plastoroseomonas hellenica]